jgi:hypothetical protein
MSNNNPFNLYESIPGWTIASAEIREVIKAARNKYSASDMCCKDAKEAFKDVKNILKKHSSYGAQDTESSWAACKAFCRGFDLDPDDFYGV